MQRLLLVFLGVAGPFKRKVRQRLQISTPNHQKLNVVVREASLPSTGRIANTSPVAGLAA